ncbi:MAG: DUF3226 domain-containing protein [Lachnospiraceae bacterium]|nr:DUF3226 domain-containing protein [Lachnospiraceae bacterium]
MMTELVLVEGVSDVQLISYYLQNVYGWKHERDNVLGIEPLDEHEHIESLSKNGNQVVLCGVGGNGKFAHFVEQHRVNHIIVEKDISSLMVVTDRDEASDARIRNQINSALDQISVEDNRWKENAIQDSFGQAKSIDTYLLIIPADEKGALERVIIDALNDIPEETALMGEVEQFIDVLKEGLVPDLNQINNANKATVGTFFSVRYPKKALRSFGVFISKIDWSKSASLNQLFLPFQCLGEDKPLEN